MGVCQPTREKFCIGTDGHSVSTVLFLDPNYPSTDLFHDLGQGGLPNYPSMDHFHNRCWGCLGLGVPTYMAALWHVYAIEWNPHQLLEIDFAIVIAAVEVVDDVVHCTSPKHNTHEAYEGNKYAQGATNPSYSHHYTHPSPAAESHLSPYIAI